MLRCRETGGCLEGVACVDALHDAMYEGLNMMCCMGQAAVCYVLRTVFCGPSVLQFALLLWCYGATWQCVLLAWCCTAACCAAAALCCAVGCCRALHCCSTWMQRAVPPCCGCTHPGVGHIVADLVVRTRGHTSGIAHQAADLLGLAPQGLLSVDKVKLTAPEAAVAKIDTAAGIAQDSWLSAELGAKCTGLGEGGRLLCVKDEYG